MATRLKQATALQQLKVTVSADAEESAIGIIESLLGAWPVSYSEPESDAVQLSLFFEPNNRPSSADLDLLKTRLRQLKKHGVAIGSSEVRLSRLANRDWKESWKRHFKPITIGQRILLKPSWSKQKAVSGQVVVVLDPGLSFGTGHHPTTKFCLQEIVKAQVPGTDQTLLDIGTGSGILAITARKLRFHRVEAFDFDPEAVRIANANARRNRVQHKVQARQANLSKLPVHSRKHYDVVCANLMAPLLIQERRRILNRVRVGGVLVLAGIFTHQFNEVENAFIELGACRLRSRTVGEWRSGSYRIPA